MDFDKSMAPVPMEITLDQIAKRYRYEWIFKGINFQFKQGQSYAILGPNGSGKSTLLKILSGHLTPSKGAIQFTNKGETVDKTDVYKHISYAAPYIDIIEEFNLVEAIDFHSKFKPFRENLTTNHLIEILGFKNAEDKLINNFSSGMKQRLKLLMTFASDSPVLLLDEPTTNLDLQGIEWYHELIKRFAKNRLIIVASNVETDYSFCEQRMRMTDFK